MCPQNRGKPTLLGEREGVRGERALRRNSRQYQLARIENAAVYDGVVAGVSWSMASGRYGLK